MDRSKDEKRPLDKQGIEQSHDVGLALAALGVKPDVILTSPLLRALQTAEIVAGELGQKDKMFADAALRPEARDQNFQELLRRYGNKKEVMMVGHNPSLSEFLNEFLSGGGQFHGIELKKAAIAKIEREGGTPATLKWLMPPKVIRSIQKGSASTSRPNAVSK